MAGFLKIDREQAADFLKQTKTQVISRSTKSRDPSYPVWGVHPGEKFLAYIPSFEKEDLGTVLTDPKTGEKVFNPERVFSRQISLNNSFSKIRCITGLQIPAYEQFAGVDPLDEATSRCYDVARAEIELTPPTGDDDKDRAAKRAIYNKFMHCSSPTTSYIFPVLIVPIEASTKIKPKKDEEGHATAKMYWMVLSESQWEKKWKDAAAGSEIENLAGQFFILTYPGNEGDTDGTSRRDAARDMTVIHKPDTATQKFYVDLAKTGNALALKEDHPWDKLALWNTVKEASFPDPDELLRIKKDVIGLCEIEMQKIEASKALPTAQHLAGGVAPKISVPAVGGAEVEGSDSTDFGGLIDTGE